MSEIQDNEILADCAWFADKHRGKYKLSGPHWSTIIRFTPLFDEAVRLQQRVDTLEAYIDEFTPDSMQIAQLKAENERLIVALGQLYEACMCADIEGELSELINGEILDAAQQALNEVKE